MNKLLLLPISLLLGITINVTAKSKIEPTVLKKDAEGVWVYEKVVEVPDVSREDIYKKLSSYIISTVKTGDKHTLIDDAKMEMLVSTPTLALKSKDLKGIGEQILNFKITVHFKEGKYKINATSFVYVGDLGADMGGVQGGPIETFETLKPFAKKISEEIDDSFIRFIAKLEKIANSREDSNDW